MQRPIFVRFTMLLSALCAAPAQAQTNAWSMAAQMRVQMQWQRQTMVQQSKLILTQMQTDQQLLKMQQQAARSLKPPVTKQPSLTRVKKSSAPAASSRTTAAKKPPAAKSVKTSAQTTQKTPSTKVRKTANLSGAALTALSPALARNRAAMGLRNLLPKPSVLNAGRLSPAKMAGGSASVPSTSATAGPGAQSSPTQPGNASDPPPDTPLPTEKPAPNPPPADQPPDIVDAPLDESAPLMHKVTDATVDSKPTTTQHRNDETTTSFFADSISAPSASKGKSPTGENGIMRLVSAIAAGKARPPSGMETVSIQPDRVWQTPPLPMLQPRHPVSPLLAVD
jgi:hypothetical protein